MDFGTFTLQATYACLIRAMVHVKIMFSLNVKLQHLDCPLVCWLKS